METLQQNFPAVGFVALYDINSAIAKSEHARLSRAILVN